MQKTKSIVLSNTDLSFKPILTLDGALIQQSDEVELLGVTLNKHGSFGTHVNNRINACRKNMFRFSSCGLSYPGVCTDVKSYIWKTVGIPSLMYGMECINLKKCEVDKLNSAQCNIIKSILGLSRRSHHTSLLLALDIPRIDDILRKQTVNFFNRIFRVESPLRTLQLYLMNEFVSGKGIVKGTIIERVLSAGVSPVTAALNPGFRISLQNCCGANNGLVDSLRFLLRHDNFVKPGSREHSLVGLLISAF